MEEWNKIEAELDQLGLRFIIACHNKVCCDKWSIKVFERGDNGFVVSGKTLKECVENAKGYIRRTVGVDKV